MGGNLPITMKLTAHLMVNEMLASLCQQPKTWWCECRLTVCHLGYKGETPDLQHWAKQKSLFQLLRYQKDPELADNGGKKK